MIVEQYLDWVLVRENKVDSAQPAR